MKFNITSINVTLDQFTFVWFLESTVAGHSIAKFPIYGTESDMHFVTFDSKISRNKKKFLIRLSLKLLAEH